MRPTTKDLAKHAGVSRATVDRVLNERPGVHRKTIAAVNAAIKELGFERNLSAANLAKSRVYRFRFLLPRTGGEFLDVLIEQIRELRKAVRGDNIELDYRCVLDRDPHQVVRTLAPINLKKFDGVAIMAPESPQVRDATHRLHERGVQVVQLLSGQSGDRPFDVVGSDNRAAGATAARILGSFTKAVSGRVMVVTDTMKSLDSAERRNGFDHTIQMRFPGLHALPTLETHGDDERTQQIIRRMVQTYDTLIGVYVMSSEAAATLRVLSACCDPTKLTIVAHERTPTTVELLQNDTVDALIVQNPGHVIRSAVRLLKARSDTRAPLQSQETIRIEILLQENLFG